MEIGRLWDRETEEDPLAIVGNLGAIPCNTAVNIPAQMDTYTAQLRK